MQPTPRYWRLVGELQLNIADPLKYNAMKKIGLALTVVLIFGAASFVSAQDEGFIYGKIYTYQGHVYEGPIRWGDEEVYWTDLFNASKDKNTNLNYLSRKEKDELDESLARSQRDMLGPFAFLQRFNIGRAFDDEYVHQFTCQFGDIKSLRPSSSGKKVDVEVRSGAVFSIDGSGYNDIGGEINIIDQKIGTLTIDWHDIEKIEFENTPAKLSKKFGNALYGSVATYHHGIYTGYIAWDNDERISSDKLDGYSDSKKVAVPFGAISSIENQTSSSMVVLKSGKEIEMRGSNDVNSENRGIIVYTEDGLMVEVPWSEFKKLTLNDTPFPMKKYESFQSQKEINSTIITSDGKSVAGNTIIDLDEQYDFELYQGKCERMEFTMPMRMLKKIAVKGRNSVEVQLKNGKKLLLESSQDTGENNQGVLVFTSARNPVYIPWERVNEIVIR